MFGCGKSQPDVSEPCLHLLGASMGASLASLVACLGGLKACPAGRKSRPGGLGGCRGGLRSLSVSQWRLKGLSERSGKPVWAARGLLWAVCGPARAAWAAWRLSRGRLGLVWSGPSSGLELSLQELQELQEPQEPQELQELQEPQEAPNCWKSRLEMC